VTSGDDDDGQGKRRSELDHGGDRDGSLDPLGLGPGRPWGGAGRCSDRVAPVPGAACAPRLLVCASALCPHPYLAGGHVGGALDEVSNLLHDPMFGLDGRGFGRRLGFSDGDRRNDAITTVNDVERDEPIAWWSLAHWRLRSVLPRVIASGSAVRPRYCSVKTTVGSVSARAGSARTLAWFWRRPHRARDSPPRASRGLRRGRQPRR
jgi:hypothetical protein